MYISRVRLKNIRLFKDLELHILESKKVDRRNISLPRNRTVIIGENGTCKTTLLRCIVIGLCDMAWGNALLSEKGVHLLPQHANDGRIEIDLQEERHGGDILTITTEIIKRNGKEQVAKKEPSLGEKINIPFVSAYGAGRAFASPEGSTEYRIIDSTYSLFRYDTGFNDAELILRRLRDYLGTKRYEDTFLGIKRAIGLKKEDRIVIRRGGGVEISGTGVGGDIPLEAWADGYRLTFMWILDLYGWALNARALTGNGGVRGIILIDELEQHLHPSMQASILPNLMRLLPDAQFFVTTQSPVVTLGATGNEVVRLKRVRRYVEAFEETPDLTGWSAEDVLVHERYFATKPYAHSVNRMLGEYERLSSIPPANRTREQKRKLEKLARKLQAQQLPLSKDSPLITELQRLREKLVGKDSKDD